MRSSLLRQGIALLVLSMVLFATDVPAQTSPGGPWVTSYRLNIDNEGQFATFSASKKDTAWLWLEGQDFAVDSAQFVVKTTDTTRYRTALLSANGGTPYAGYVVDSGVGVDSLSSLVPALNGMYVWGLQEPGAQRIGLVIQFSAAGNHAQVSRIASLKYEVWVRVFYRRRVP